MNLSIKTTKKTEMIDITSMITRAVESSGIKEGLCILFVPHTTAAITVNESADPSVKSDILMILNRIIPWEADYRHLEGNSPAHVKSTLVGVSEQLVIEKGSLILGTWQGIFFCEFDGPRTRKVVLKIYE